MLEKKEMDGSEKPVAAVRTPLELEDGLKYKVVLRGLGTYYGGYKVDFDTGQVTDEKIENAALIVANPENLEEVYIISAPVESVLGKSILALGEKDERGVYWLKKELLNKVGWIGVKTKKTKEEYNRGYKQLFWTEEGTMEQAPEEPELVGAEQRRIMEGEEEGGVMIL